MNRRTFLKILAAAGIAPIIPQVSSLSTMYKKADAAIDYSSLNITASSVPSVMPQVINLFLYGGPSELAGNLTNIADINQNSQTKYTNFFSHILSPQGTVGGGSITQNGFWGRDTVPNNNDADNGLGAGGDDMQFLLDQGHMSVYRTMMSRKNTSQSHRENILMSQKGSLDVDFAPGMGNKLASIIANHRALFEANTKLAGGASIPDVEQLTMPFISIADGDTRVFDKGDSAPLPLLFNGVSVKEDLSNPFTRNIDSLAGGALTKEEKSAIFDDLVSQTVSADTKDYTEVNEAFQQREELEQVMQVFSGGFVLPTLTEAADIAENGGSTLAYPDTGVGRSLRAAVTMAVENPSTLFITLGGAFGGWDDHNNGVDRYPARMRQVFEALRVAMMHIKYSGTQTNAGYTTPKTGASRPTDNIIINVFGEFGRRVNLNSSLGWNHGNNQNFYTLGGSMPGLRTPVGSLSNGLGKVVGTTVLVGNAGADRQFTEPADASYEFEPISIAANIYKHFGVVYPAEVNATTPDPLTATFDPDNSSVVLDPGSPPIDENPATNGGV